MAWQQSDLARLAFVSPRIVEDIANANAPADLTVTIACALQHGCYFGIGLID